MKIFVGPGNPGYDKDRQICNARFDYRPLAIPTARTPRRFAATVIRKAHDSKKAVHRSGGRRRRRYVHRQQRAAHEYLLHQFDRLPRQRGARLWIGAGAPLSKVYVDLESGLSVFRRRLRRRSCRRTDPGRRLGPVARQFGLTCDSLVGVEMVTAKGAVVTIFRMETKTSLLWALRGGGGGNFGVVTKFSVWCPGCMPSIR